jgi:hypothetical protein
MTPEPNTDWRIVPCDACGTEGRIYRQGRHCWDEIDYGQCPYCEGTGGEIIEVQPIDMEDLP